MYTLGGCIDEFQCELLASLAAHLGKQRLPKSDNLLSLAHRGPFDHDPILIDVAVMRKASHWGDTLLRQIVLCGRVVRVLGKVLADPVDLLVDLCAVMVAHLTCPRHLPLDPRRVPRADARNLPQSAVRLPDQPGDTPASDNALHTLALGHTDAIDHLILRETICDLHSLLEKPPHKINLLRDRASVDLDLLDVGLLLPDLQLGDLSVANRPHHVAILLDAIELCFHGLSPFCFARFAPALLILGEGLLLRLVPVFVEPPLALLAQVACPSARQGTHPPRCLDVPHKAHNHHGRSLQDRHWLADLLLVQLGARLVDLSDDVRHPGLVGHEGREVRRLRGVILGEAPDPAEVVLRALPRREAQAAMAGALELAVRHAAGPDSPQTLIQKAL